MSEYKRPDLMARVLQVLRSAQWNDDDFQVVSVEEDYDEESDPSSWDAYVTVTMSGYGPRRQIIGIPFGLQYGDIKVMAGQGDCPFTATAQSLWVWAYYEGCAKLAEKIRSLEARLHRIEKITQEDEL